MVAETRTQEEEEDHGGLEASLPVPPDGGWGWVVVAASFMVNLIVDGVCYSFGVFYVEYLAYFQSSKAKTTLVGALLPSMYLLIGPLVSALANKFGCRAVTMAGGVVACCAFVCSTFSTSIEHLIIIYGVIGGFGFGLMYLPSIVIVSFYFDKRRALATGIAVCGSGVGTFAFAPLSKYLLNEFGWKGANWILGGVILNTCICGALFRPLELPKPPKDPSRSEDVSSAVLKSSIMQKIIAEKKRQRTISTGSLDNTVITAKNMLIKDPDILRQVQEIIIEEEAEAEEKQKLLEKPTSCQEAHSPDDSQSPASPHLRHKRLERLISEAESSSLNVHHHHDENSMIGASATSLRSIDSKSRRRAQEEANRPMYRQDIFYTGSVTSIAEYKSCQDMSTYTSSIASMPSIPQDKNTLSSRCLPFVFVLKGMFDISLFKSPTFILFLLATGVLAFAGFFIPYLYMVENAMLLGVDQSKATFLLSIAGISNIIGRLGAGLLADRPWADSVIIHNVSLLIAGIVTIIVPLLKVYSLLAAYAGVFGVCIAAFIALRSIVAVELLGIHRLTNSFGLMLLFQGAAGLIGSPIAGALFDATNSYTISFVVAGSVITIGALMSFPIRAISRWENRRQSGKAYVSQEMGEMGASSDLLPLPSEPQEKQTAAVSFNPGSNTDHTPHSDNDDEESIDVSLKGGAVKFSGLKDIG